jgi:hypothetical protein
MSTRQVSDADLLAALRKQADTLIAAGKDPWVLLLIWDGQPGVQRDDVIDVLKEVSKQS